VLVEGAWRSWLYAFASGIFTPKVPEYPDLEVYRAALAPRVVGQKLLGLRLGSPFVLRTVEPPRAALEGRTVLGTRRVGKRLVLELEGELFVVVHLMIAGRLQWKPPGAKIPGRAGLAAFDFGAGTLLLTEVSSKKRASIHLVQGEASLRALDRGGLEVVGAHLDDFAAALRRENHTLKRSLTDPRLFAGIGNAYSDEILHRARLSPVKQTKQLSGEEIARLHQATVEVLGEWKERLLAEVGEGWPQTVTAFRPEMAVHGKYRQPCPRCGAPVQRIVHADNETNYCARCQTGGRLLADRSLSRLLKEDWPGTLDDLEEYVASRTGVR
jgi:formamidopyrimidine-DNA glycosylase